MQKDMNKGNWLILGYYLVYGSESPLSNLVGTIKRTRSFLNRGVFEAQTTTIQELQQLSVIRTYDIFDIRMLHNFHDIIFAFRDFSWPTKKID